MNINGNANSKIANNRAFSIELSEYISYNITRMTRLSAFIYRTFAKPSTGRMIACNQGHQVYTGPQGPSKDTCLQQR